MPYISKYERREVEEILQAFDSLSSHTASGTLNFLITSLFLTQEMKTYEDFNRLIGILESVKLELYRRKIAPYEYTKMKENGDVY